jgi:hypothetical protein
MRGGCATGADSDEAAAVGSSAQIWRAGEARADLAGTTLHADARRGAASTHSKGSLPGEKPDSCRGVLANDASEEGVGERERRRGAVVSEENEA